MYNYDKYSTFNDYYDTTASVITYSFPIHNLNFFFKV